MKTVTTLLAVVGFAALMIVPSLQAQDLQTGTWTGTVTPPNGEVFEITYDVENVNDTLTVTMNSPIGPRPFRDIVVGSKKELAELQAAIGGDLEARSDLGTPPEASGDGAAGSFEQRS